MTVRRWIWGRWPLLVVAAFLVSFGSLAASDSNEYTRIVGTVILSLGAITLGSWITTEVIDWWTSTADGTGDGESDDDLTIPG